MALLLVMISIVAFLIVAFYFTQIPSNEDDNETRID